eukprot:evm.model.NODE_30405_length_21186_cov_23.722647.1
MDILLNAIKEDDGGAKTKGTRPGAAGTAAAGASVETQAQENSPASSVTGGKK